VTAHCLEHCTFSDLQIFSKEKLFRLISKDASDIVPEKERSCMAEKTTHTPEEEIHRLKARVAELEADATRKDAKTDRGEEARRVTDSFSDAARQKADAANRAFRGIALASFEGMRLFADSISAFAGGVVNRSNTSEKKSVRDLATQLPGDVVSSFADAVDKMVDIPAKTAERYADSYRQGEQSAPR
jgi:hypothetical protein